MSKIALNNSTITQTVVSNHITYRVWEYQYTTPTYCNSWDDNGNCTGYGGGVAVYDWNYYQTSANINGYGVSSVANVKINGQSPIVVGDRTIETDTYSIPSGEYVSGAHTNAQGSVNIGNTKNVYINGKLVVVGGSNSVTTHAGTSASFSGGLSTTVDIG